MSFSRYNIEKKQISTDNGVHWVDVEPAETQKGALVGVARTLLECEDMACELSMDVIEFVDEPVPTEICTSYDNVIGESVFYGYIPSGIAKNIRFTSPRACCCDSHGCRYVYATGEAHDDYHGVSRAVKYGELNGESRLSESYSWELAGRSFDIDPFPCEPNCVEITSFMPWIDTESTIKVAYAAHYKREHCSDEWELDESNPRTRIGLGERWEKTYEDIYMQTWQHQVVSRVEYQTDPRTLKISGYTIIWEDNGEPFNYYFDDVNVPENIEVIEAIKTDGVASNYLLGFKSEYHMAMKADVDRGTPSGTVLSCLDTANYETGFGSGATIVESESKYYVNEPTADGAARELYTDKYHYIYFGMLRDGYLRDYIWKPRKSTFSLLYSRYRGEPAENAGNVLTCVSVGKVVPNFGDIIYYPYRIYENHGSENDYYNFSELGFIDRRGNKIVLEYYDGETLRPGA